jgi:hypothetical protein
MTCRNSMIKWVQFLFYKTAEVEILAVFKRVQLKG